MEDTDYIDEFGRAIPFADLERFSKYKQWKKVPIDIKLDDNRNWVVQQLYYLLRKNQNPYFPMVSVEDMLSYGCWCNLLEDKLKQGLMKLPHYKYKLYH